MRESNATINSYFFASSTTRDDATLQDMSHGRARASGMLRDREYNNGGEDGKNTVATVRDTMRDERTKESVDETRNEGKKDRDEVVYFFLAAFSADFVTVHRMRTSL